MKFKKNWHKRARLQSMALQDWGGFMCDNELGGQGKNHIVFVGFILMVYGLILTLAWSFSVFFLVLAAPVFVLTKNPFTFMFYTYVVWMWGVNKKAYRSHFRFSIFNIDVYMINGYIFAPGRYLQQNLKKGFDALEKNLDENSA